jgi:hypothetical protein
LFEILVEVRDQYWTELPVGIEADSIEAQEYRRTQRSEFERHVMELAPSVLAPDQLVFLDQQYQRLSYQRANDLEIDRKGRAQDPHFPLALSVWD